MICFNFNFFVSIVSFRNLMMISEAELLYSGDVSTITSREKCTEEYMTGFTKGIQIACTHF